MKLTTAQRAALVLTSRVWKRDDSLVVDDQILAVAVSMGELGVDRDIGPSSYNGSCCYGWFQINLSAHRDKIPGRTDDAKKRYLYKALGNMKVAEKVWQEAGNSWDPWEVFTNGSYAQHVPAARKVLNRTDINLDDILEDSPFGSIPNPLSPLAGIAEFITDKHNWLRIAAFLAGLVILVMAGYPLVKGTAIGGAIRR